MDTIHKLLRQVPKTLYRPPRTANFDRADRVRLALHRVFECLQYARAGRVLECPLYARTRANESFGND